MEQAVGSEFEGQPFRVDVVLHHFSAVVDDEVRDSGDSSSVIVDDGGLIPHRPCCSSERTWRIRPKLGRRFRLSTWIFPKPEFNFERQTE
jgi:hypothetical protein